MVLIEEKNLSTRVHNSPCAFGGVDYLCLDFRIAKIIAFSVKASCLYTLFRWISSKKDLSMWFFFGGTYCSVRWGILLKLPPDSSLSAEKDVALSVSPTLPCKVNICKCNCKLKFHQIFFTDTGFRLYFVHLL